MMARLLHFQVLILLAALIMVFNLGLWSFAGLFAVSVLLAYEHSLVRPNDLTKLNAAFFTMNGVIAVVFFIFVAADLLLR
jgi:4-hydroxybenzoate polyprenyltransferase